MDVKLIRGHVIDETVPSCFMHNTANSALKEFPRLTVCRLWTCQKLLVIPESVAPVEVDLYSGA